MEWKIESAGKIPFGVEPEQILQLIGAVERLRQSVIISEVILHLERIDFNVRLLGQCGQLPQEHSEGPLHSSIHQLMASSFVDF